ncbi:hypothetical protein U27_00314 [Candidatus Vecturithrix granuli]|uniref:Uncharacterized protein n=1 Tax=Vecturithrix granuli TaxID=1499967 RepID=A0A081C762_VECG1|nr:hypothetical protein U27_00314 [Candidatus Vecturithrix granuli]
MKKLGIAVSLVVGLLMLAVPAMAIGQNQTQSACSEYGCGYAPYGYYNPSGGYNNNGFMGYDWSRYPGSTEYCSKWIPGHWVAVRVMMPGRWIYRPVWIPGYPTTRYQWVGGFWQTTGYHTRPDVYVSGSHAGGWYGMPYQDYQSMGGGYFNEADVWVPQTNK